MSLPTPEQERAAVLALFGFTFLAAFGAAALLTLIAWGMAQIADWVFA
jgi:hypothetical protein